MKKIAIIAFYLILLISVSAEVKIIDGDTFLEDSITFRIWGIDAPERGQPWADVATAAITELLRGGKFVYDKRGTSYGRTVAIVSVGEMDVGLMLISMGLAWHDKRYAPKRDDYEAAMEQAKKERRGIWFNADPVAPWDYRNQKKGDKK